MFLHSLLPNLDFSFPSMLSFLLIGSMAWRRIQRQRPFHWESVAAEGEEGASMQRWGASIEIEFGNISRNGMRRL